MSASRKSAWALAVAIMWAAPATAQITDPEWLAGLERSTSEWACVQRIKEYLVAPSTLKVKKRFLRDSHYSDPSDDTDSFYEWEFTFEALNRMGVPVIIRRECYVSAAVYGSYFAVRLSWEDMEPMDRVDQQTRFAEDIEAAAELWTENERRANQRDFKNR